MVGPPYEKSAWSEQPSERQASSLTCASASSVIGRTHWLRTIRSRDFDKIRMEYLRPAVDAEVVSPLSARPPRRSCSLTRETSAAGRDCFCPARPA
jgi:hypothetical protein